VQKSLQGNLFAVGSFTNVEDVELREAAGNVRSFIDRYVVLGALADNDSDVVIKLRLPSAMMNL
jgi:hypothetical protein